MSTVPLEFREHVAAMQERYPSLEFRLDETGGRPLAVWKGWLTPIRSRKEINGILCDLDADLPVWIDQDASIRHDRSCAMKHVDHRILRRLKRPDRSFLIEIVFGGGPAHPKACLLDPVVTPVTRRHIMGDNRICAYHPSHGVWNVDRDDVADFTDHILVWLFKWCTWVETGHWPGEEMRHDPIFLLTDINPETECWCGSGSSYQDCHRPRDKEKATAELSEILASHSRLRQKPRYEKESLRRIFKFLN